MKKSLLALAVLGAFAGVASAQSSVTLYGTVDLNARYVKNDAAGGTTNRRYSLGQDGINSSQLGFKGVEDLGGGLKAGFDLLAGVNADTGSTNTKFFNRRAIVELGGNFGRVRLGRDYVPSFWNNTIFDAFGTNGLGDSSHVQQKGTGTFVRADNSIGYFLPAGIGGVYGQLMVAAAEGAPVSTAPAGAQANNATLINNPGRYVGGRVGFAAGPVDVAVAYAVQEFASGALDQKTFNVGASYDLGVVKLLGYVDQDKQGADKENRGSISAVVPLGQGEIHAGYSLSKRDNGNVAGSPTTKIDQFALGYVYNLSKRTALYSTVSRVNNKNLTSASVSSAAGSAVAAPVAGGKSVGAEFGLRHFF